MVTKNAAALAKEIKRHQKLYDRGAPEIEDSEFDALVEELRELEPEHPVLDHLGNASSDLPKLVHEPQMLSLAKIYDLPALTAWFVRSGGTRRGDREHYLVQPKYDGVALSLKYVGGQLVAAALRGSGKEGDLVTSSIRNVTRSSDGSVDIGIPLSVTKDAGGLLVHDEDFEGVVRGELLMPKSIFAAKYAGTYANPRNLIAGMISRKGYTPELDDARFIAYDLYTFGNLSTLQKLKRLSDLGFDTGNWAKVDNFDNLHRVVQEDWRGRNDFELDGVVIKVNSALGREKAGATAHHPNWAVAWKYQGESGRTKLVAVEWSVARTGAVTPVAIMQPIELSGVTITRATLHNASTLVDLGLTIDAELVVTRRGGVIPHVESAKPVPGQPILEIPDQCPGCQQRLVWSTTAAGKGADVICRNPKCPAVLRERIRHWCKVTGMLGIGPEFIDRLVSSCGVEDIVGLYTLKTKTLRAAGFGPRQAEMVLEEIEKTLTLTDAKFFEALGIPHVGTVAAERLAREFDWETGAIRAGGGRTLTALQSVKTALSNLTDLITRLLVHIRIEKFNEGDGYSGARTPFTAKAVVFTGKLTDMERTTAQEVVRSYGGLTPAGLTRSVDYLVVGDHAKPNELHKRNKAEEYNRKGAKIAVISETEFIQMLAEADKAAESAVIE